MKKIITIAIINKNAFFNFGLMSLLREYFPGSEYNLLFKQELSANVAEDLVFCSIPTNRKGHYCQKKKDTGHGKTLYFSLAPKRTTYMEEKEHCLNESGIIYFDDSPGFVYQLLDNRWQTRSHPSTSARRCPQCSVSRLTPRERQVMDYLCTGISQSQVAEHMHLSVKTINAHKQSLMRKMDLKKKQDFIYWLINREDNTYDYVD